MEFSASQIAELLGGEIDGNPDVVVHTLSKIEDGVPKSLSFLSNPSYTPYIYTTKASIVLVNKDFAQEKEVEATMIKVDDAYQGFAKLLEVYDQARKNKTGIEEPSYISKSAKLGKNIYVGTFAHIGSDAQIGDNVKIYPNVYIGEDVVVKANTTIYAGAKICAGCVIGSDCTIHMGVIVGGDGFGFTPNSENNYEKVAQTGNVIIEDFVDIGANTTIDRATVGSTIIGKGVKLDNLIQIAHNVEIGENTIIAAQTGIAGSTKIGKDCMIGGQVGIIGHITIADKVKIAAQSGVANSITTEGELVQGSPAYGIGDYKRSYILFKKLPELQMRMDELEEELNQLKQANSIIG